MTSSEHMAHCQAMRGGVTESESALIADLAAMESLAIGGEGTTHWYYRDVWEAERARAEKAEQASEEHYANWITAERERDALRDKVNEYTKTIDDLMQERHDRQRVDAAREVKP